VAAVTKPAEAASEPVIARAAAPTSEKASPVVRRRARELGIDLETIRGSGSGGRVLLEDLAPVPKEQPVTIQAATVTTPEQTDAADHQDAEALPLSRMREAIARTVSLSWRNIPHFAVTMDIRMDHAAEVRRELKGNGKPVSINELVMKGVALTLRKCPMVNASYLDGSIVLHQEVHIGVMVKVTDGLLAPVIRSCQSLSLTELAAKSRELIQRARNATITEAELSGGTISVSNLGAYGVKQFTAIILPPQVAILAVGAITERLVPGKGGPVAAQIMRVTLSADHRVLDGVAAAEFLLELKQVLENPVRLLL
jgi:pyruvate dehydrogenase E2 component (dihydrolipoamide acetyltransferase)